VEINKMKNYAGKIIRISIVKAQKMNYQEYYKYKYRENLKLSEKYEGYIVIGEDHKLSWWPKIVFEEHFKEINESEKIMLEKILGG
jgi:hypothetical protein